MLPSRVAQVGSAFQEDFVVISASFCILGGSRAHPSFSRGELGCAHGSVPTNPALAWGSPWGWGSSRAALGPGVWGTRRRNQIQPKDQTEGIVHMLIAELALPPLGAKNTFGDT